MEQDDFSSISISEIAANAGLDRRTFYRHFKTKEDIIAYYMKSSAMDYEMVLSHSVTFDNKTITKAIFTICQKQCNELSLLLRHKLSHLLLAEMSSAFSTFQNKYASQEELVHPHRNYRLAYHVGGFWNIINQWILNGCKESPDEMAEIIEQMLQNNQI